MRTSALVLLVVGSALLAGACSPASSSNTASSSASGGTPATQANAPAANCGGFPVAIYASHTSLSCETTAGPPLNQTAYIESADSVATVAAYYKSQVQATGWTVDPMEVESPTHTVVSMKKGKGYASVVINAVANGTGSRTQIHAYPNGG